MLIGNKGTSAVNCIKKVRERFYDKLDTNNINDNKLFWKTVKPFLSEKGTLSAKITLVESGEIISEDKIISETFNTFFCRHS